MHGLKYGFLIQEIPYYVRKREDGYYIQTWHGTPLKKLGMDMDNVFMAGSGDIVTYKCNFFNDSRKWDFVLSQNNFSTEIFKSAFAFSDKYPNIKKSGPMVILEMMF